MSRCWYCDWSGKQHDPACPYQVVLRDAQWVIVRTPKLHNTWSKGWDDGRRGVAPQEEQNQTYMLGFIAGECAREEAENGYDPVWMS